KDQPATQSLKQTATIGRRCYENDFAEVIFDTVERRDAWIFDRIEEPGLNRSADRMHFVDEDHAFPNPDVGAAGLRRDLLVFRQLVDKLFRFPEIDTVEKDIVFAKKLLANRA